MAVDPLPPARIADALADVDTPALILDLDAFEANVAAMQAWADAHKVRLRPHAKSHKCAVIAHRQIAAGAVGVCAQKVSEAAALVDAGVGDVLVSNEVMGEAKAARLAALAGRARMSVCVDDHRQIAPLSHAAVAADVTIHVLVEIEVGQQRCGCAPGATAAQIAQALDAAPGLRFEGIQAYNGAAQHFRSPSERAAAVEHARRLVGETVEALAAHGLTPGVIGGAGTGTFYLESSLGPWNEIQPGSYAFMDADYARNAAAQGDHPAFRHALFVLARVMSRTRAGLAVVDAGHKAIPVDSGPPQPWARPGVRYERPSDEHGCLMADDDALLPDLGETLLLVPGHCDPTVNQHDHMVAVRGLLQGAGRVEDIWPVVARGCYR